MTLISISIIMTLAAVLTLKEGSKNYYVRKIKGHLLVTGKGTDPAWNKARTLSDFRYPWENAAAPATKFRALHNDAWVYCLFEVTDENVHIFRDKDHKVEVAASSRAEIFFRMDEKLTPYYCLEMDAAGRVMDYRANHYRQFDLEWTWPQGQLEVKAQRFKGGYTVELAVSKASLTELGLLIGNSIQAGLFRGDCFPKKAGDPDFKWISWIQPDSKTPDFHIPSAFGLLNLEE